MQTSFNSTAGLIPILFSLIGLLLALQYLKGAADFSKTMRSLFIGFALIFVSKLLMFAHSKMPEAYYYFLYLFLHLSSAFFIILGCLSFKSNKSYGRFFITIANVLLLVWSWYVVLILRDMRILTFSLACSTVGYAFLATTLWRRKTLRNSIGFVITGWFCIFLVLYNLLVLMPWGQSLLSPAFETFIYISIMCGWILISNNLMAHQFDLLEQTAIESKERLRLMIQMSPFPIIISRLKDDQLMLINNKAGALFGLDIKRPGNFKTVDYFADPNKRKELLAKLEKNPVVDDFEFLVQPRKGNPFWLLLSARVIDFEYEIALYMAFQDITDRKKKELQLFDQATKDPLTGCYNRRQFEELARKELQRSRRYGHSFCLFMIDADHFKNVNDSHGHAVGDLVLQALSDCCHRTLRESDIIARFGGEEFVILLPEVDIDNAHRVAERLRIKISKLVVKNEQNKDVMFTVSIGLVSSTITDNIDEMLKMSDESLYVAKENGRNRVIIYDENGPNKDIPAPEGEDIDKIKAEPLFYFKPKTAANIKMHDDEPAETGVVGLSGDVAYEEELELDEAEFDYNSEEGVSLNNLYEDDGEDDGFVATNRPVVEEQTVVPNFYEQEDEIEQTPIETDAFFEEDTFEDKLEEDFKEEELLPEEPFLEEELDVVSEDIVVEEDVYESEPEMESEPESDIELVDDIYEPEPEIESEPEPESEADTEIDDDEINQLIEEFSSNSDEIVAEDNVIEDELIFESEAMFEPAPVAVVPPPPPPPVVEPVKPAIKMMKKVVKVPVGMVKVPKMPGAVRAKMPMPHHGVPVPPPVKPPVE